MKIVQKREIIPRFKSIKVAECFRFQQVCGSDGSLWMKISDDGRNNAVCLASGDLLEVHPERAVTPIKAEVVEK